MSFLSSLFSKFLLCFFLFFNSFTLFFPCFVDKASNLIFNIFEPTHLLFPNFFLSFIDIFRLNLLIDNLDFRRRCWGLTSSAIRSSHWIYKSAKLTLPFHEHALLSFKFWFFFLFILYFFHDIFLNKFSDIPTINQNNSSILLIVDVK